MKKRNEIHKTKISSLVTEDVADFRKYENVPEFFITTQLRRSGVPSILSRYDSVTQLH